MAQCTVYLSDELEDEIEETLGYGDSKSGFLKEAARRELQRRVNEGTDE